MQQFLPGAKEPWSCCKAKAAFRASLSSALETGPYFTQLVHACIPHLTPEPPDVTTSAPSLWCLYVPFYHVSSCLYCYTTAADIQKTSVLLYLQLTVDPLVADTALPTDNVGDATVSMWDRAAGEHARGWKDRGQWGTARCIEWHSSLRDSVGSVHDNHHVFWRAVPAPVGRGEVSGLLFTWNLFCFRSFQETHT